jgi:pimeloyl-ACP methyl ester carboxylesterase
MATYVLIPGSDGRAWYWNRLAPLLRAGGHDVVAVDLPASDPAAGFEAYVAAVVSAIAHRRSDLIVVAQSLAGFTAPLVADRVPVSLMILLNAMVPRPGESAGEWWENTGHEKARAAYYARNALELPPEFDPLEAFFHDVPSEVVQEAMAMGEPVVRFDTLFREPWPLSGWPNVPTRFIQARDDRFFPLDFQRRVVTERLAIPVEEIPGGHLVALSRPLELAQVLESGNASM